MTASKKVVVIGGGTMGADVGLVFLRGGYAVEIIEAGSERRAFLPQYFEFQIKELGYAKPNHPVSVHADLNDVTWPSVDLVVECIPEKLPLKQELFKQLDQLAPAHTILASNSSSFPISQIAAGLKTTSRMIGLHFFMPAHLVPCVEVIKGEKTSQAVMDDLFQIMTRCLMVPVRVNKDLPGFLANRLQHAMSREAFSMIDQGIATPEDIDNAVRFGFGFRYLAAGPVMQRDHAGVEIHTAAGASIYPSLCTDATPAKCLTDKVKNNHYGMKTSQGFYSWTPETIKVERNRYDTILKAGLKIIQKDIEDICR